MRALILTLVLVPTIAVAEDCSCLNDRHLTQSCIDFSYTDEFLDCENVPDDKERIADLEDKTDKLAAQVRRLIATQRKARK